MNRKLRILALVLSVVIAAGALSLSACKKETGEKITIGFNLNGAPFAQPQNDITVTVGKKYGSLPSPSGTHFTFNNWYTNRTNMSATNLVTADTLVSLAYDHVLYADWTGKPINVTFDLNGGTYYGDDEIPGVTAEYGKMYGAAVPRPPQPPEDIPAGDYPWIFHYWYAVVDGERVEITPDSMVAIDTDHTLVAYFAPPKTVWDFSKEEDRPWMEFLYATDSLHNGTCPGTEWNESGEYPTLTITDAALHAVAVIYREPVLEGEVVTFELEIDLPEGSSDMSLPIWFKIGAVGGIAEWDELKVAGSDKLQWTGLSSGIIRVESIPAVRYLNQGAILWICSWGSIPSAGMPIHTSVPGTVYTFRSVTKLPALPERDSWNFASSLDARYFDTENHLNGGAAAPYIDAAKNDLGKKWLALTAGGWGNVMLMPPALGIGGVITFTVDYSGSKPAAEISFAHATSEWTMITTALSAEPLGGNIWRLTMTRPSGSRNTISLGNGLSGRTVYITDVVIT